MDKSPLNENPAAIIIGVLYYWAKSNPNSKLTEDEIYNKFHALAVKHPDLFKHFYFTEHFGKFWHSKELEDILTGCHIWGTLQTWAPFYKYTEVREPDIGLEVLRERYGQKKVSMLEPLAVEFAG